MKITVIFADSQSNMLPSNMRYIAASLTNQIADILCVDDKRRIHKNVKIKSSINQEKIQRERENPILSKSKILQENHPIQIKKRRQLKIEPETEKEF